MKVLLCSPKKKTIHILRVKEMNLLGEYRSTPGNMGKKNGMNNLLLIDFNHHLLQYMQTVSLIHSLYKVPSNDQFNVAIR
jgi:hypothetical protein